MNAINFPTFLAWVRPKQPFRKEHKVKSLERSKDQSSNQYTSFYDTYNLHKYKLNNAYKYEYHNKESIDENKPG